MDQLKPGDEIQIQCDIGPGAFPSEFLVTFETVDGPISGFVRRENVVDIVHSESGDVGYILGKVEDVSADIITVLVRGSFFTTTGIASLTRDWASTHVQVAHAA